MEAARTGAAAPPLSCAQRLIGVFVDETCAAVATDVSHSIDYASLGDLEHPASWEEIRVRVVAIARALSGALPDDCGAITLAFGGVRVSGSVHIEITVSDGTIEADALGSAIDRFGGAVLLAEDRRLVVAFFPRIAVRA